MLEVLSTIWASDLIRKLIFSAVVLLLYLALRRWSVQLVLARISDDSPHFYTIRKVTGYAIAALTILLAHWELP